LVICVEIYLFILDFPIYFNIGYQSIL
jgi:hypothetical protein